jgi:hypothetical protein
VTDLLLEKIKLEEAAKLFGVKGRSEHSYNDGV